MTQQLLIDEDTPPIQLARSTDPETSHMAASSLDQTKAKAIMDQILWRLKQDGPLTSGELADRMKMDHGKVWKRCSDLKNGGQIVPNGTRKWTGSNRQQTIWRVA